MFSRILALALFVLSIAPLAAADSEPQPRTISVTGTAVTQTVPDLISWDISVSDFDKDLARAKDSNGAKLKALLALAPELGFKPEDVQTGQLSITRVYNHDERGAQTDFKHFAVVRSISLKQRDLSRFDEVLTKLVSKADIETRFTFASSREQELRAETRLKAVRAAKEKAEAMIKELGAALGRVQSVSEVSAAPFQAAPASNIVYAEPAKPNADQISGTLAPGSIPITVSVNVSFQIQ